MQLSYNSSKHGENFIFQAWWDNTKKHDYQSDIH